MKDAYLAFVFPAERVEALEASMLTLEVLVREVSSILDILLINFGRMQRAVIPSEKRIARPHGMPKLPLQNVNDLKLFEKFLQASDSTWVQL